MNKIFELRRQINTEKMKMIRGSVGSALVATKLPNLTDRVKAHLPSLSGELLLLERLIQQNLTGYFNPEGKFLFYV